MVVSIFAALLCVKKLSENNEWKCPVAYTSPRRNQREVLAFSSTPSWTPKPDSKAYQSTAAGKQERVACFLLIGVTKTKGMMELSRFLRLLNSVFC